MTSPRWYSTISARYSHSDTVRPLFLIEQNTYTYGDTDWKDKLTAYNGIDITYDAGGNPTLYRGYTFAWEKGRQLKSAVGNSNTITYTYNANGTRTGKTVNGVEHKYVIDGANILRETYGTAALDYLYDNEDGICGLKYNGTPYYFYKNLQGDIIAITNSSGDVVAKYSYDAWGDCAIDFDDSSVSIATVNPFRYRGYYQDTETEYYYLQSRYYDAVVGRFVNADAAMMLQMTQGNILRANMYAYCENNTVNCSDPSGNAAVIDDAAYISIAIIILLAIGVIASISYLSTPTYKKSASGYKSYMGNSYKNVFDTIGAWFATTTAAISAAAATTMEISKTQEKAKTKIKSERKKYEYWIAVKVVFKDGRSVFIPTAGVEYSAAISLLRAGCDLFASSAKSAKKVARAAGNAEPVWEWEVYKGLQYMPHYHAQIINISSTGIRQKVRIGGHAFYIPFI